MRTIEAMQRQLLGLIGRAVVKSISARHEMSDRGMCP
ncbi:putative phage baseplate protein [Escherichia coli]|nr:putative phage baseplate protein [Escherichia coli]